MNGIHCLNPLEDHGSGSAAAKVFSYKPKNFGNTHSGGFWDPVAALPPELALTCLREALPWSSNYSATLLDMSSVCSRWQDFLLSTPILWSEIHIEPSTNDLLAIIALFTHLSSKVRLKLIFWNLPGPEWDAIKSALLPHTHRIDALVLGDTLSVTGTGSGCIYISVIGAIIKSLDYPPSLAELDFGCVLVFDSSDLPLLDLPPNIRIISPIEILVVYGPVQRFFLTHFTGTGRAQVKYLLLSELLRKNGLESPADEDYSVLALNARISSLRHIIELLGSPSINAENLASSPCRILIERAGDGCLICGCRKPSLEDVFGCIRSHFGLFPFKCSGCQSCTDIAG
jgi:hypothetical protein